MFDFTIDSCRLLNDIIIGLIKPSYAEKFFGQNAVKSLVDLAEYFTEKTQKTFLNLKSKTIGFTVIKKGDVSYIIVFDDNNKVIIDILRFGKNNDNVKDLETFYSKITESNNKNIRIKIQFHKNLIDYFQNSFILYNVDDEIIRFTNNLEKAIRCSRMNDIRRICAIWKYNADEKEIVANPDFTSLIESATLHVSSIDFNFKENMP